jgi:hypothetical protein
MPMTRTFWFGIVVMLFICADVQAQASMHRADVHAGAEDLAAVRDVVSQVVVDAQAGPAQKAQFLESARTDLVASLDEVIRELAVLRDRFRRDSAIERSHVQKAQNALDWLKQQIDSMEAPLLEIRADEDEVSLTADRLLDAAVEIRYILPRIMRALDGLE